MRPCGATRAGTQAPNLPTSIIFFHASRTNKITIYAQSAQTKPTVHVQSAPTHLHQTLWCAITHCTFDSSKPHGVPIPHRGYTFDSAGLASVTQPTLGNNASEEATPLGVVLFPSHCFSMSSPTHTSGAEMHRALPPPFFKTSCVCKLASR